VDNKCGRRPFKTEVLRGIGNALLSSMCSKTSFLITATINILFVGLMAKLLGSLNKHAPVGYQDESGFHYGVRKS
jgi:hypothetical protein